MALAPSSPRLPSPPPPAEIQITPNSPSGGPAVHPHTTLMEQNLVDSNSRRRIHPGTKAYEMAAGPPLVPLSELQEHLSALHYHHTDRGTKPIDRDTAMQLAHPPAGIDRTLWLYELCRFLISQCNTLIVGFLFDAPPCSASTCPEMRASEWQFLCAVHEQPKSCCAIDYCCHTLDWAANVVTDQKLFPSRFVALDSSSAAHSTTGTSSKNASVKSLVNVFRRLHRIFAHAWFQHRKVFWSVESQSGLYVFFKMVCDLYELLPAENYKLPPEAEGIEEPQQRQQQTQPDAYSSRPTPTILKPPSQQNDTAGQDENDSMHPRSAANTNTKRHIRSSPSTGSAVTTVIEAEEEETDGVTQRVRELRITAPNEEEEEEEGGPEVAEVPMMVEEDSSNENNSSSSTTTALAPESSTQAPSPPAEDNNVNDAHGDAETDAETETVVAASESEEEEEEDSSKAETEEAAASTFPESKETPSQEKGDEKDGDKDSTAVSLPESSTTVKLDADTDESASKLADATDETTDKSDG
ncbi:Mob1/phocein family [Geosmithia morbida]|uniref:Mob1/phocein family n=1 Tax=Geosmithia morbida TaxID=1094350 RepID=A0A9P4Z2X5_9HYPO|nr:Mob1/phocein family [Geosmithia morbida]KAF4126730.1 Mob1/phocein family [Geosmithia morbida]